MDPEFSAKYARARDVQAERFADELVDIADESDSEDVSKAKLRIETRKWVISKILPKKYGDKLDLTNAGEKFEAVRVYIPSNGRDDNQNVQE